MKIKAIKTSLLIVVVLIFNSCAIFLQKAGMKNYTLSEDIASGEYNDYQSDFMYLTQLLDIGFPDIDSVFPREDRIDQRNVIMESLSEADIEDKDFVLQTRKYLSNFHNQHTTLYLKSDFEKVYPFVIHIYDNQWFLLNVDNSQDRQHIGQRITKINNMEVSDIENRLLQFTFGENRINQQYELSNRQFYNKPAYLKDVHTINKLSDKLKIEFADHSKLYLEAVSTSDIRLHEIQIPSNEITGFQKQTYRYTTHAEEDFAYLQFHNCHDKIDILEGIESYVKPWLQPLARAYVKGQFKKEKPSKKISSFYNPEYPIFKDFVWELVDSINNANIQNLVIDLRGNPGGNLTLGIQLLYFLTDQKDLKGFTEYAFTSEVYKHYFASDYAALENRYPERVLSNVLVLYFFIRLFDSSIGKTKNDLDSKQSTKGIQNTIS